MSDMTDQELQALVNSTGLIPCDRLPKPNPRKSLEDFLVHAAVCINGAVKSGKTEHKFRAYGIPNIPFKTLNEAVPVLERLGYKTSISTDNVEGEPPTMVTYLVVSGWGD